MDKRKLNVIFVIRFNFGLLREKKPLTSNNGDCFFFCCWAQNGNYNKMNDDVHLKIPSLPVDVEISTGFIGRHKSDGIRLEIDNSFCDCHWESEFSPSSRLSVIKSLNWNQLWRRSIFELWMLVQTSWLFCAPFLIVYLSITLASIYPLREKNRRSP